MTFKVVVTVAPGRTAVLKLPTFDPLTFHNSTAYRTTRVLCFVVVGAATPAEMVLDFTDTPTFCAMATDGNFSIFTDDPAAAEKNGTTTVGETSERGLEDPAVRASTTNL